MARQRKTGRKKGSTRSVKDSARSKAGGRGSSAAHRGTSRGARHLNDDFDAGDVRDEDRGPRHVDDYEERRRDEVPYGEINHGDASGFGRPLSFQGKGFFGGGAPYEQGPPHIGMGHAVGYGPGRHSSGGGFRGRGPRGYRRSDERLTEDINDRLTYDDDVDATEITVSVESGEATLSGTVTSRAEKRRAEDIADNVSGITHVQNNLRVKTAPK